MTTRRTGGRLRWLRLVWMGLPGLVGFVAATLALRLVAAPPDGLPAAAQDAPADALPAGAQAERGAYLAIVGNCAGCHGTPGGAAYAGGRALPTPFGPVYAGNLTPDRDSGIGRWSADDFYRALHHGRSRDGRRLVPAFPYTAYTRVARADSDALFAYLRSLPAVRQPNRPHELRFPFGTQPALALWQWLHFEPAPPRPAPPADGSAARGAYLVQGLGHCAGCHAPYSSLGAAADALTGGVIPAQRWYAPSLHPSAAPAGSDAGNDEDEQVALLRSGRNRQGSASGPMAAVVFSSTQHWQQSDLQAVARYLATLPPVATAPPARFTTPAVDAGSRGRLLYAERCADCHGADGQGVPGAYPPLAGNPSVLQPAVHNLVQVLRHGSFGPATQAHPRPYGMPPQDLDLADTTALINHLRTSWGHRAATLSEVEVMKAW